MLLDLIGIPMRVPRLELRLLQTQKFIEDTFVHWRLRVGHELLQLAFLASHELHQQLVFLLLSLPLCREQQHELALLQLVPRRIQAVLHLLSKFPSELRLHLELPDPIQLDTPRVQGGDVTQPAALGDHLRLCRRIRHLGRWLRGRGVANLVLRAADELGEALCARRIGGRLRSLGNEKRREVVLFPFAIASGTADVSFGLSLLLQIPLDGAEGG
mmetsp:Transcript_92677/g.181571  ORF Transcript_92677/g.181571 Transcript_92677/m.181571 type:complete len:215 (-) Transcript_92677:129-773(-)